MPVQKKHLISFLSQALKVRGYERLVLQVGRGSLLPAADSCPHIRLEAFRFKDSIAEDVRQADLIVSHAGEVKHQTSSGHFLLLTLCTQEARASDQVTNSVYHYLKQALSRFIFFRVQKQLSQQRWSLNKQTRLAHSCASRVTMWYMFCEMF